MKTAFLTRSATTKPTSKIIAAVIALGIKVITLTTISERSLIDASCAAILTTKSIANQKSNLPINSPGVALIPTLVITPVTPDFSKRSSTPRRAKATPTNFANSLAKTKPRNNSTPARSSLGINSAKSSDILIRASLIFAKKEATVNEESAPPPVGVAPSANFSTFAARSAPASAFAIKNMM